MLLITQKAFYNRKEGLFSKVNQLSVLCGVQSFLVIVDKKNFVYIYSSEEDYMNSLNTALSNKKNIKNFYTKQNVSDLLNSSISYYVLFHY